MTITHRDVAAGFEQAAAVVEAAAAEDDDYQAQLHVRVAGRTVVDIAAGIDPDALMTVYSTSKGLAAIAIALLVDDGALDLDATVASYWPEFAAAGKDAVTVRQLLSHQAGIPETDAGIPVDAWLDPHAAAALLAAQRPFWRPGAAFGYHSIAIGSLLSELCFRITGRTAQELYEERVRSIAGADAYLGLPAELEDRVVELLPMHVPASAPAFTRGSYGSHVFQDRSEVVLSQRARAFGQPAAAGVASARGLATVYQWATGFGAESGGVSPATQDAFAQTQVAGYDLVLDQPMRSHGIVFQKPTPAMPFGSYRAFGHDGAAGAMAFADPVGEIVLGYTVRRAPFPGGMDRRVIDVVRAVHEALGA